jgi:uncharacterized protein with NAD-binding domain and iron-sulfur cluster
LNQPWDARPLSENCVTIFGGGIAGLTVAHELSERGFQVQVWEPAQDPRYPRRGCDIGGMARTQWSRVHWEDTRSLDRFEPFPASHQPAQPGHQTQPIRHFPQRLSISEMEPGDLTLSHPLSLDEGGSDDDIPLEPAREWAIPPEATGMDVVVRGWEQMNLDDREQFARRTQAALAATLGSAVSAPYFDFEARIWSIRISREHSGLLVIFTGGFPDSLAGRAGERRVPADAFALLTLWTQSKDSSRLIPGIRALFTHWKLDEKNIQGIGAWGSTDVRVIFAELIDTLEANPLIRHVYVEFSDRHFGKLSNGERLARARHITDVFRRYLPGGVDLGNPESIPEAQQPQRLRAELAVNGHKVRLEIIPLAEFPERDVPESIQILIGLRVRERWLPGEHGYRFFPAFYRHLYDTMRRTPILEPTEKSEFSQEQERSVSITTPEKARYVESPRTAFDNLHPTSRHVIAFSQAASPAVLSRARPTSLEELRQYVRLLFGSVEEGGFGTNPRESTRFALKLMKYLTTGSTRRRQLERSSWWDYVEGETYSKGVRTLIERWPEALVAMDAKRADARTHGNALVQLVLDNLGTPGYRDGTLRGPTSEAWLSHWRRYLEAQGVEFIHGELKGFRQPEPGSDEKRPWPVVSCYEPRYSQSVSEDVPLMPGYFVLAASAPRSAELAREFRRVCREMNVLCPDDDSDLQRTSELSLGDTSKANPDGDLRHFAGIQFYFAEDVLWVDGHVYYPDSPWGLTSISQARFWEDRTDWEHGYRGILSAIIGKWDEPGLFIPKPAWDCSPVELATEVWQQIKASVRSRHRGGRQTRPGTFVEEAAGNRLPDPLYFHLDDSLTWNEGERRYTNSQPFHIASPTGWSRRPGDPRCGFKVEHGWVVCGMFTKTFTRAPSMEAANESGRHAVNAILAHHCSDAGASRALRGTRCQLFDPEEYEVDDLRWFKDLDEKLAARGLPHFMDILNIDEHTDTLFRGGPDDPLDPINVLRQLGRVRRSVKGLLFPYFRRAH